MGIIKWLFGSKEHISDKALEHSSKGEYQSNGRIKSGGHGEECLKHLKDNNIEYNIVRTYRNGVRVGNIPSHDKKAKRTGANQSWFPKDWDREKIKKAGQVVSRGEKKPDGEIKEGKYDNVNVGVIRTKGKIATIFPTSTQKNRKGGVLSERRQSKRTNSRKK